MESLLWDEIFGVQGKIPFWTPARRLDKWDKAWISSLRVETHPGLSHPSPKGKAPGVITLTISFSLDVLPLFEPRPVLWLIWEVACQPLDKYLSASWSAPNQPHDDHLLSRANSTSQPVDQHLSAAWCAPISRFISTCQPVDQHQSAAWSAPIIGLISPCQPVDQQLSAAC